MALVNSGPATTGTTGPYTTCTTPVLTPLPDPPDYRIIGFSFLEPVAGCLGPVDRDYWVVDPIEVVDRDYAFVVVFGQCRVVEG